jgi:hypothetical protein
MDVNEHKKMNESNALVAIFHLVCSKDTKVLSLQFSLHLTYKCLYDRHPVVFQATECLIPSLSGYRMPHPLPFRLQNASSPPFQATECLIPSPI